MASDFGKAVSGAASGAAGGAAFGPLGAAIGGGLGILGGILGNSNEDAEASARLQQEALDILNNLPDLDPASLEVTFERLRQQGVLTPQLEEAVKQGASQMQQVRTDQRLKDAQMGALAKMQQVGEAGLTSEDRAAMNALTRQVERDEQARQQSILQQRQMRGMGGSGDELAAQLASSQAAAERQAAGADRLSAQANQRALEAIMQSGRLGGEIRSQDFGEQSRIAQAADEIARFNASQAAGVQQRNVGSQNEAQRYNLGEKQRISDSNVGMTNQEQLRHAQLLQDAYNRKIQKAQIQANARLGQATNLQNRQDRSDSEFSGVMQGAVGAATSIGTKFAPKALTKDEEAEKERIDTMSKKYPRVYGGPAKV